MSEASKSQNCRDLLAFIDSCPTPYHAVAESSRRLRAAGFSELDERDAWQIEPGAKHYLVKGGGTLVAFVAGQSSPEEAGFVLLGAHTDSPNLRVKPLADITASGHRQVAVEVYGGVLLSTWLDRDLSLAGRVTAHDGATHLLRIERPLLRIPNLAIHLNRDVNSAGLLLNAQNHLMPLSALNGKSDDTKLSVVLADALAAGGAKVSPDQIAGFDLCLYDTQAAGVGGVHDELIFAPRLDNLASCHAALTALTASGNAGRHTRMVALYDHEEVGSQSAAGARSRFLGSVLDRLSHAPRSATHEAASRARARSLLVSADMAHALHPNYAEKHDKQNAPRLGKGPVIKVNANQSYATDGPSEAWFAGLCQATDVRTQRFVSRNDMPCGSTIGPISAAMLGLRTLDIGNPMHSMHSCREGAAVADVDPMIAAMTTLLRAENIPAPRD